MRGDSGILVVHRVTELMFAHVTAQTNEPFLLARRGARGSCGGRQQFVVMTAGHFTSEKSDTLVC